MITLFNVKIKPTNLYFMKKNYSTALKKLLFVIGCAISFITANVNAQTYCNPTFRTSSNTCTTYRLRALTIGNITTPDNTNCTTSNYTASVINTAPGQTVSYSITLGNYCSFAIYADFNKDGDFDDANEFLKAGQPSYTATIGTATGTFVMPATVSGGNYRLRIIGVWGDDPTLWIGAGQACGNFSGREAGGNFQDYTLNVVGPAATAVTVTPVNSVAAAITTNGGTLPLAAAVAPATANQAVTWGIATGAEFASISATGVVTAIKNGTVTVKATSTSTPAISGTINVVITNQIVAATAVTVTTVNNVAATITTAAGTLPLVATVTPADATDKSVNWSITAGAEFASVSATGVVTAIKNGTITVKATSVATPAVSGTINVVVTNQPIAATGVVVSTLNDAAKTITIDKGTLQLVGTVSPTDATDKNVTWSITAGSEFATISATGLVTAIKDGTVTVKATSVSTPAISGTTDVVITNQITKPATVVVTTQGEAAATITTNGGTLSLVATVAPADATDKSVTWAVTTGAEFASVSAAGVVTAVKNGTVTVTATAVADATVSDAIEIVITNQIVAVDEVVVATVNEAAATISAKGGTLQLVATVTPADATDKSVTWTVSDGEEFASVSATGLVTAILNGKATVRATSVADTSLFDEIEVTVTGNLSTGKFDKSLVKVYPNPTTGVVFIQSQEVLKQFAVYNMLGQQVNARTSNEVNLANVQNGVYLLEVTFVNGQKLSQKIIKN